MTNRSNRVYGQSHTVPKIGMERGGSIDCHDSPRGTTFAIAQKKHLTRENVYDGGKNRFEWVVVDCSARFKNRVSAMRYYFGVEAIDWSDDMVKRQFKTIQYGFKHAKIVGLK